MNALTSNVGIDDGLLLEEAGRVAAVEVVDLLVFVASWCLLK